jgi:hypothetical protein
VKTNLRMDRFYRFARIKSAEQNPLTTKDTRVHKGKTARQAIYLPARLR